MHGSRRRGAPGQRQVHMPRGERLPMLLCLERFLPCRQGILEAALRFVRFLADPWPSGGGNLAEASQERGELTRAPEHTYAHLLERRRGSGPGDICQGPVEDVLDPRARRHRLALLGGDDRRELGEGGRIRDGKLREDLAVEGDAGPLEPVHEDRVGQADLAAGRVDADDPEGARAALLLLAAPVGEGPGPEHRLGGGAVELAPPAEIALGLLEYFLSALAGLGPALCPWHLVLSFAL